MVSVKTSSGTAVASVRILASGVEVRNTTRIENKTSRSTFASVLILVVEAAGLFVSTSAVVRIIFCLSESSIAVLFDSSNSASVLYVNYVDVGYRRVQSLLAFKRGVAKDSISFRGVSGTNVIPNKAAATRVLNTLILGQTSNNVGRVDQLLSIALQLVSVVVDTHRFVSTAILIP